MKNGPIVNEIFGDKLATKKYGIVYFLNFGNSFKLNQYNL